MRKVFYCPAVIGFAASLVEEMKEIKEIQVSDVACGLHVENVARTENYLRHIGYYKFSAYLYPLLTGLPCILV